MNEFEQLKSIFKILGFDIEKYKINDYHYKCTEDIITEKLRISGYYIQWFELWLNKDYSIKKLEITNSV